MHAHTATALVSVPTYAGGQIIGKRDEQQDTFAIHDEGQTKGLDTPHLLLVVADGMGGHVGGATASSLAVKAFVATYQQTDGPVMARLDAGLDMANRAIADGVEESPALSGMGCTLVGVVVTEAGVDWISVGDSPLWLLKSDGLHRLNADHSLKTDLDRMVERGILTAEEAATDNRRHMLRSAVMGNTLELVDRSPSPVPVAGGRLILATDGLETLSLDEIGAIAADATHDTPDACVSALLSAVSAKAEPRQDNVTVIAYWDKDESPPPPSP